MAEEAQETAGAPPRGSGTAAILLLVGLILIAVWGWDRYRFYRDFKSTIGAGVRFFGFDHGFMDRQAAFAAQMAPDEQLNVVDRAGLKEEAPGHYVGKLPSGATLMLNGANPGSVNVTFYLLAP